MLRVKLSFLFPIPKVGNRPGHFLFPIPNVKKSFLFMPGGGRREKAGGKSEEGEGRRKKGSFNAQDFPGHQKTFHGDGEDCRDKPG